MVVINNIKWVLYQNVLVPDAPPDMPIELTNDQIKYLLRISKAYFIRWVSDFDCGYETEFWYIIKDDYSVLASLSQNTRHNVRRGLKRCVIKKVCAQIIADEGYEVYGKAFDNYDTFIQPESKDQFTKNILSKKNNSGWEFWGVWNLDAKMIAFSMNQIFENKCSYATTKFHPDYLRLYPSDSLFFIMNYHYINERGMKYINDGPRSLSHKTTIQDYFINKFNFRKAYCKLHIHYSIKIKLLVLLLYPFRKIISLINLNLTNKLTVLLKYEQNRKSFEK